MTEVVTRDSCNDTLETSLLSLCYEIGLRINCHFTLSPGSRARVFIQQSVHLNGYKYLIEVSHLVKKIIMIMNFF